MNARVAFSLLTFAALTCATAFAADWPIDDFSTGAYASPQYKSGQHATSQTGSMLGGSRSTSIWPCSTCATQNPYNQVSSYTIQPATKNAVSAFVSSQGFFVGPRIEIGYGYVTPMAIDFTPYDRIRLNFLGLTQTLNFNILLYTGTAYAQGGCNISPYGGSFSVELPLANFVQNSGFSLSKVNLIDLILQNGSVLGSVNYAITSVQLSNTPMPGAVSCHF